MGIYESITLDPDRREIRLLHISPGSRDEPIKTELSRVSLDETPSYSVLSYSWGPENDKVPIQVQGKDLQVTRNLHQCLMKLRQETAPFVIWIDAVCINQNSNQDKNTQVPLMRDIYKSAQQAYVWLGEATAGLDLVFASVEIISSRDKDYRLEKLEDIGDQLRTSPELTLKAFSEFLDLAWFRRTWIIQEFILPRQDPIFVCGDHRVPWPSFQQWWRVLSACNRNITNHTELAQAHPSWQRLHHVLSNQAIYNIDTLRTGFSNSKVLEHGLPLSTLVGWSEGSLATNPRDKIYGIMGLANAEVNEKLKVDYNKPVPDLYEEASRYLIFEECKLNILSNQSLDLEPEWDGAEETAMPPEKFSFRLKWGKNVTTSWIRDFSHVHTSFRVQPLLPDWAERGSTYDTSLLSKPLDGRNRQKGELGIAGIQLDVVKECERAWYVLPGKIQYFKNWDAILPLFFRAARSTKDDPQPEKQQPVWEGEKSRDPRWDLSYNPKDGPLKTMKEAIWRTLICDKLHDGIASAPEYCGKFFDGYIDAVLGDSDKVTIPTEAATSLEEGLSLWNKFQQRLDRMLFRRSAYSTVYGWIGLGPDRMKAGDVIVILSGGDVPFVLRPWKDDKTDKIYHSLIGECYVEGVMYGEVIEARRKDDKMEGHLFSIR
ncbi:Fc.00g005480.m01.CDS01 [Cosmosporella sp. VM-42]